MMDAREKTIERRRRDVIGRRRSAAAAAAAACTQNTAAAVDTRTTFLDLPSRHQLKSHYRFLHHC